MSTAKDLGRVIGSAATARLIADFGGRRIYIPRSENPGQFLVRSIGLPALHQLTQVFGGDRLRIPLRNLGPRRALIVRLRGRGMSVPAIAQRLGCSERRVFQVLAAERSRAS